VEWRHDEGCASPIRDEVATNLFGAGVIDDDATLTKEGTPFGDSEEGLQGDFAKKRCTDKDYT
jgi:hypothetical protein